MPDSDVIKTNWIPYLSSELSESLDPENRNEKSGTVLIRSLGILGHPDSGKVLVQLIDGKFGKVSKTLRLFSVFGLRITSGLDRNRFKPVLSSIVEDFGQDQEVRLAALSVLLESQPSRTDLSKIISMTWTEPSEQVSEPSLDPPSPTRGQSYKI